MGLSDSVTQAVPGLGGSFQRRGEQVAAGEAAVVDGLVQRQHIRVAKDRIADRPGAGQGWQYAMAGKPL
ncbi:hypothetical protein D3C80_2100280 [compost metagenome]